MNRKSPGGDRRPPNPPAEGLAARTISILLVDDHPENVLALEAVAERISRLHNLWRASSGAEALS